MITSRQGFPVVAVAVAQAVREEPDQVVIWDVHSDLPVAEALQVVSRAVQAVMEQMAQQV